MNWLKGLTLLAVIAMIGGCSDKGQTVKQQSVSPEQSVKAALEDLAKTGQGGSQIGLLMEELGKLKKDKPQLAESLAKDAEKMMSMNSEKQVQALAKEMLKKLATGGSGGGK